MTVGDLLREELHDLQRGVFLFPFSFISVCVFTSVYVVCLFLFVCLNSITMLEFFIFVKYLSNIEDNV